MAAKKMSKESRATYNSDKASLKKILKAEEDSVSGDPKKEAKAAKTLEKEYAKKPHLEQLAERSFNQKTDGTKEFNAKMKAGLDARHGVSERKC